MEQSAAQFIAFEGSRRVAAGGLHEVVRSVKGVLDSRPDAQVLVFEQSTSELRGVDFRGTLEQVLQRLESQDSGVHGAVGDAAPARSGGPGRPRLGVVAREVTLLPRHWDWLAKQPGGASVALRKLVEQARRSNEPADSLRHAQEVSYRFMSAMAGNLAGFEEAARALFAGDQARFAMLVEPWPDDIRGHLRTLSAPAFAANHATETSHA